MGVNYQTLYSLISGKNNNPKIDTIKKICDYF
nr:helix-turn-helix transcriptional regulator [Enterovibrio nigricans]